MNLNPDVIPMNRPTFSALAALILLTSALVPETAPSVAAAEPQAVCPPYTDETLPVRLPHPEDGLRTFLDDPTALPEESIEVGHDFRVGVAAMYFGGSIYWDGSVHAYVELDGQCVFVDGGPGGFDNDADGMADKWVDYWEQLSGAILNATLDTDGDELDNLWEFQWDLVPVCLPHKIPVPREQYQQNCRDHEANTTTGQDGDGWLDGPEVQYWNDERNDYTMGLQIPFATYDPDRLIDSDHDGLPNVLDVDADNDTLLDGPEALIHDSFPEFRDSDCSVEATACPPPRLSPASLREPGQGAGTGDGLNDSVELTAWASISASAVWMDWDGDGIVPNLLDPDSDGDGLLDSLEFDAALHQGQVKPHVADTEGDGLRDGDEQAWNLDTDLDGRVNANDPDSDNDGMPDAWEAQYGLSMTNPTDATLDPDTDLLVNLDEFRHGTDPTNPDCDKDFVRDGDEITHGSNPLFWDTDGDKMADYFEIANDLDPVNAGDADDDPDADTYDGPQAGIEGPWPNLAEYGYGKYPSYNEANQGPWLLGTQPRDFDTDDDGAPDGYEAYTKTNPRVPVDTRGDPDLDGLNFTQEFNAGTSYLDPDTDKDGLCDGGRAENCRHPLTGAAGYQPGESDYGTMPRDWDTDDDLLGDGREAAMWDKAASGSDADIDGDFLGGMTDRDSDNDRLSDGNEVIYLHTNETIVDTDGDALGDGDEHYKHWTNPLNNDTDRDTLLDGQEVLVHKTQPYFADSDGDGLRDDDELRRGTNPMRRDTDRDGPSDGWEVQWQTDPLVPDSDVDWELDGLTNHWEARIGTHPRNNDTDGDRMPDLWEHQYGLNPAQARSWTGSQWRDERDLDLDMDALSNAAELAKQTRPDVPDTDGDGSGDGFEVLQATTDPLKADTDDDGLGDHDERLAWDGLGVNWRVNHDGDVFVNSLVDSDSDNDGLSDHEEILATKTKPQDDDSDGDDVPDKAEVSQPTPTNPNDPDSDGDGRRDFDDPPAGDRNEDPDQDGLTTEKEGLLGTDPNKEDSDCDGANDGGEYYYWGKSWNRNLSGTGTLNRLLTPDVDTDGLKDGAEIGSTGMGSQFAYTLPDRPDTDFDGLWDNEEKQTHTPQVCNPTRASSSRSAPLTIPGAPVLDAVLKLPLLGNLGSLVGIESSPIEDAESNVEDAESMVAPSDGVSAPYIQGAYGVRFDVPAPNPMASAGIGGPSTNGHETAADNWDSDGDGLSDGSEVFGSKNPYKAQRWQSNLAGGNTNPMDSDTDHDGIGDGLELGISVANPWIMNPNRDDTDGDGLRDTVEDTNQDGVRDLKRDPTTGHYVPRGNAPAASSPIDADTDDDGVKDDLEAAKGTSPLKWDSDLDGLSDGLETGATELVKQDGITYTLETVEAFGLPGWTTWQKWQGTLDTAGNKITTSATDADSDDDGIIDGLEDLSRDARYNGGELLANDSDTDNDGLADGLELRIWGPTNNPERAPFSFREAVDHWRPTSISNLASKLQWNPANKLQTNPRDINTDDDSANDGDDVNPLGNSSMNLTFGRFQMTEAPDGCCDGGWNKNDWAADWNPEIKIALMATLPSNVGFTANTVKLEFPGVREEMDVGDFLATQGEFLEGNPTSPAGLARLAWTGGTVAMDLFEAVNKFPTTSPCKDAICISVRFREIDFSEHNDVDLHPSDGRTYYGQGGIQDWPISFAATPCESTEVGVEMFGGGDKRDQDGILRLTSDISIFQNFLENARTHQNNPTGVVAPPTGDVGQHFGEACP